ncbi:MAG: beta-N-acetylhexosaminidase [Rhodospirillaceae bacterium]|nr:MAG: beta-N-acetylhexosaminidase [Rhodospirillaceae bacterium]
MWGASLPASSIIPPRAIIFGLSGPVLTGKERRFFAASEPLGFILFSRNVDHPSQVCSLVAALRDLVGRADAPILVDQEGGRVQRLLPPYWRKAPAAAVFEPLSTRKEGLAAMAARLNSRLLATELADLGIDVDCAPVADVPVEGAHDIIGDRAYSHDPKMAALLTRAACDGFLDGGVLPVIKHLPGHGRARADSHLELPVVTASVAELENTDFLPFRALADMPWGMTAHVVYTAFDSRYPATLSPRVVGDVIRRRIGFDGLLLTDDLSMKALSGDFSARTGQAFIAGCDVALHCNGDLAEMRAIVAAAPRLSDRAMERLARGAALRRQRLAAAAPEMDVSRTKAALDGWLRNWPQREWMP